MRLSAAAGSSSFAAALTRVAACPVAPRPTPVRSMTGHSQLVRLALRHSSGHSRSRTLTLKLSAAGCVAYVTAALFARAAKSEQPNRRMRSSSLKGASSAAKLCGYGEESVVSSAEEAAFGIAPVRGVVCLQYSSYFPWPDQRS